MSDRRKSGLHENLDRELQHEGPSDRSFGLTFFAFFALVALLPLVKHRSPRVWAICLSGIFLLVAIASPHVLKPLNVLWAKVGLLLSRITNPVVTGLMFFLFFVPSSLILRLLGKDPLRLKFDRDAASYWIPRVPPGPTPESMRHQF
jgi:saxitoxin biosynthesis operon SxtJ-like protein